MFYRTCLKILIRISPIVPSRVYLPIYYKLRLNKKLNLKNPKLYTEKIQWMKVHKKLDNYAPLVDKYEVKKYVSEKIGDEYTIPTLGVWDSFDEIDFNLLPNEFVLKCTHDSGSVVICNDKNNFDYEVARKKICVALKRKFYLRGKEFQYRNIKPRVIAEKYMVDESGTELKDFKFFCFDGKAKIIMVDYNRFSGHKRNVYDLEWNYLPVITQFPTDPKMVINKPDKLNEMICIAEQLADGFPHVRVDLYVIDSNIYFGEMTFTHGSGLTRIEPIEFDEQMGEWFVLPKEEEDN